MTFSTASAFILPFGDFKGQALDQVAQSDDGLRYLDNLRGKLDTDAAEGRWLSRDAYNTKRNLAVYLDDPAIAKEATALARAER